MLRFTRTATVRRSAVMAALSLLSAGIVLAGGGSASASVSKYHGKWVSQVSGCNHNYRIGKTARLVTDTGKDYGWVEWRASRTKRCAGYQWVRFHFSHDLGFVRNEANTKYSTMAYKRDPWGSSLASNWKYNKKKNGVRYLKAGAYNSRIFYAPNEKACAQLETYYSTNSDHGLNIKGQGRHTGDLRYCA
ncbi:hypothetical protein [Actinoplanes sp. NPDC049118]|uniref:hypothetical protein n=1 Tax=Actinoplanes sp. NPDC049118 TaxID=3155769 RepID=UPI0033C6A8FE